MERGGACSSRGNFYQRSWEVDDLRDERFGADPFSCTPAIIVKYIRSLYESGVAYFTVNHHRSSISKFHEGFAGQAIGSHPLVSKAVKAVFRLRPPSTFLQFFYTC